MEHDSAFGLPCQEQVMSLCLSALSFRGWSGVCPMQYGDWKTWNRMPRTRSFQTHGRPVEPQLVKEGSFPPD